MVYKAIHENSDTVLDPFMGSGTTLRVATALNRKAIGIDISSEYFESVAKPIFRW